MPAVMTASHNDRPVDLVLARLTDRGCNPRQSGHGWTARCPNNDGHTRGDKRPSLSVAEGSDGKALVTCFAGCNLPDIARALDLGLPDLFPDRPVPRIDQGRRIKATYSYYDDTGTLIFEVVRFDPKDFRQRRPDPDKPGQWAWNLHGIDHLPLYHAPQVAKAITDGKPIWIVEGEKDAEALQWEVDGATTTCPQGAGKWRPEHTEALNGATNVTIIHDADEAGLRHARDIVRHLRPLGPRITVLRPPGTHKDTAEALGAGRTIDEFEVVWDSDTGTTDETLETDSDWARQPLAETLTAITNGDHQPTQPTVLAVEGGPPLFYPGRINSLFGESGSGKTWVAIAAAVERITTGERILFIDFEDVTAGLAERLHQLGVAPEHADLIDYRNPDTDLRHGLELIAEQQGDTNYGTIIVDSTGEAMSTGAVNPNADDEVAAWFRALKRFFQFGNPAIIVLDHIPKDKESPSAFAIGSQRKRAAITGAAYRVDTVKSPARGQDGRLKLTVAKDRMGTRPKGTIAAIVDIETSHDGALSLWFHTETDGGWQRPTGYMERVSRWLELHPQAGSRELHDGVQGKREPIERALGVLISEGFVTVTAGPRGAKLHTSVNPFREGEDMTRAPRPTAALDEGARVDSPPKTPTRAPRPTAALDEGARVGDDPRTAAHPLKGGRGGTRVETAADTALKPATAALDETDETGLW